MGLLTLFYIEYVSVDFAVDIESLLFVIYSLFLHLALH